MDTTIINCDCLCHSLHVRPDVDSKTVDISLWNYGFNDGKLNWKKRLKILMDGFAHSDLVVLDKDELDKLIIALQEAREKID
jgi:inorganic pyrophosphatase